MRVSSSVEVDRAAAVALGVQRMEQIVQRLQLERRLAAGELRPDLGVGETRARAEHGRIELVARHLALGGDRHHPHTIARRSTFKR